MITAFSVTPAQSGQVVNLEWAVQSDAVYQVQMATNPLDDLTNRWSNLGLPLASPTNTLSTTNFGTEAFYRVQGTPAP